MAVSKLSILGYRGFGIEQSLNIAVPNGNYGSGLTVLVGPNNSGKSSIIEAFRAVSSNANPSFTEGKRNKTARDKVKIVLINENGNTRTLKTLDTGGSETEFLEAGFPRNSLKVFTIQSRRAFNPFFHKNPWTRGQVLENSNLPANRGAAYDIFTYRLFEILKNKTAFNKVLEKVLYPLPDWTIEQSDEGNFYLKFFSTHNSHNSEGAGEGLLSLFTIVDALYDSSPGDIIAIDEPELSLHPALQKRLCHLLAEYAGDRQIIISTHSPYFVSWHSLMYGGMMARVVKENDNSMIYQISADTPKIVEGILNNRNNPHILGFDAKEVFFLEDNINIVEGQEDVIFYERISDLLKIPLSGYFFGWGVGGAGNFRSILTMLKSLGYKKVVGILDRNMQTVKAQLEKEFSHYYFVTIPTDDVRSKDEVKPRSAIEGLVDSSGKSLNPKYESDIKKIVEEINKYQTS